MIIAPKIRGFICTTAHPAGCAKHVAQQIDVVKSRGPIANGPKKVLVIGSSTGYGLSSRIAAAFGSGAATIGVFFERPGEADRTATAGWYNTAAFENEAKAAGLYARSFNGDAYSDPIKEEVIAAIKADLGQVDCVIYSLASPRRTHPKTGEVFKSVLKPTGDTYTNKNLNTGTGVVNEVTIEPAQGDDIAQTIAVMGGEGAATILFRKEIAEAPDPEAARKRYAEEYRQRYLNPYAAAEGGFIDEVIEPSETRARLIGALTALRQKAVIPLGRRHGNMPA